MTTEIKSSEVAQSLINRWRLIAQHRPAEKDTPMERAATNPTRESGMTILEVLFAMVILAILMMGALQSLLAASMLNQETSRQAAVANLLRDKTSEVLRKAKQYTPDAPLVRDSGKQYSNIDAMIRWYADSANHSFQLDRNTFKAPAVGANALDIVNGTVTCFLNELQIPGDLGGSRTNPLWDNVLHVGPMDLDGVNDTTGTADGRGND